MKFKAVLFDMDGLMTDTETLHIRAWDVFLADFGVKLPESYLGRFVGMSIAANMREVMNTFGVKGSLEDLIIRRRDKYLDLVRQTGLTPAKGMKEILADIESKGLLKAIGTSSPRIEVELVAGMVLKALGIKKGPYEYFNTVVNAEDVAEPKPAPDIYLKCAEKLNLKPAECLVLEDSSSGIKSAKRAGCYCVAVQSPYSGHHDLTIADKNVDSLLDVLDLL